MALGPHKQGATRPSWTVQVVKADHSPLDISGATFTGVLFELQSNQKKTLTVGSYSITDAANGTFSYAPVSGDVDTPGVWAFETILTIGGQTYVIETDDPIVISPKRA